MGCGLGLLLRRTVLPQRAWVLWAPCQARGIGGGKGSGRDGRGGARFVMWRGKGNGSPNESGTAIRLGGAVTGCGGVGEAVVGGIMWLGLLLRRTVLPWRSWLLWAPCQARGIGGERGEGGMAGVGRGRCGRCGGGGRSGSPNKSGTEILRGAVLRGMMWELCVGCIGRQRSGLAGCRLSQTPVGL